MIKKHKGFTLIEILIVIAIMSILATAVLLSLNPLVRFQASRNSRRSTDIAALSLAIKLDQIDHAGVYDLGFDMIEENLYYQIGTGEDCAMACLNPTVVLQDQCFDADSFVENGYLPQIPIDPSMDKDHLDGEYTWYYLMKSNGTVTVGACNEEKGTDTEIKPIYIVR